MRTRIASTAAFAAALLVGMPAFADIVGVSRCDQQENGVFRPGLMTVAPDGTRTLYPVGENGLTETIIFSRSEAFAWVESQGLFPAGTTFANYNGYICGLPCEECAPEDAAADAEEPGETNGNDHQQDRDRDREGNDD
jgi:hypothetical protein